MTLPSSGPLKLSQIAAEFGVSLPCVFPDDFYGKPGVPTSGALSFSDFYGLSNVLFTPDGGAVSSGKDGILTLTCNRPAVWTFPVTGSIPSGSTATSVTFTTTSIFPFDFTCTGTALGVTRTFAVHMFFSDAGPGGP